jgi:hypothetical protein
VARETIGSKREEVTGHLSKLHSASSMISALTSIIPLIKSNRMRRMGYVALMWDGIGTRMVLVGKSEGKRLHRKLSVNELRLLKYILKN